MVNSVSAISTSDKVKRDSSKSGNGYAGGKQGNPMFAQILEEKREERSEAARECYTITYGKNSQLQTFQYRTREYHY